jgi:hypothetical protein
MPTALDFRKVGGHFIGIDMIGFEYWLDVDVLCRVAGVFGFFSYIGGFAALQLQWINGEGLLYSASKVAGAVLVLNSLTVDFNLSAALIQVSFLGIGVVGLCLRYRRATKRDWYGSGQ